MAKSKYYGLILAGGRGTRFWPRSRKRSAKQVLNIGVGDTTLIQATVERLAPLIPPERIWILTNEFVRDEIVRQLPNVPPRQIIPEPAQRNTAPAIGLAAHILESIDPDAIFGVFPSDHVIGNPKRFLNHVRAALRAAEEDMISVLGIAPRWPETGYGYVEFPKGTAAGKLEAVPVKKFREKPELKVAKKFLRAGHFYWNAGMFFWKATTILDGLRLHLPKTATLISSLPPFAHKEFAERVAKVFPLCEDISIDYAVLQRADNVVGVPCDDFGWNDVGSWHAVYELLPRDSNRNASRSSELLSKKSSGNYVDCGKKIVALLGVKDLIIVDTPDAILVADRGRAQQVGDIVRMLEEQRRHDLL